MEDREYPHLPEDMQAPANVYEPPSGAQVFAAAMVLLAAVGMLTCLALAVVAQCLGL